MPLVTPRLAPALLACACALAPLFADTAEAFAPESDPVVVTVDGASIRESEILAECDERVNIYAAESATKGLIYDESSRPQTRAFMRDEALHVLVNRRLVAARLAADGIEITDAEVDTAFEAKLRERGQTRAEAEAEIAEQGKSMAGVRARIRWNNLAVRKLYGLHAADKKPVTEEEARLAYLANPDEFKQEHERRVSRILVIATRDHDEAFRADAKLRAEAILARLRAGEDFAAVAREKSEDVHTRAKGGDRGWSPRGFVTAPGNDPFGDAAFALGKVGDFSGVVQTIDGYEIILLTGLREERQKSFAEVRDEILSKREYARIGVFWNTYANRLKQEAAVVWSPAELARREEKARRDREYVASAESAKPSAAGPTDFVRVRPATP